MREPYIKETFINDLGDVRECLGCRALIAGGPTRCIRCAKEGDPKKSWRKRIWFRIWYLSWLRQFRWFGKLEDYQQGDGQRCD